MKALFKKWEIQRAEAMKRHSTNNWKILGLPNNSSQPHTNSLSSKAPGFWKQGSVILRGCVQGTFLVSWSFQRTYTPSPRVPTQMANSNCKWWTTCLTCWNIASVSALFVLISTHAMHVYWFTQHCAPSWSMFELWEHQGSYAAASHLTMYSLPCIS